MYDPHQSTRVTKEGTIKKYTNIVRGYKNRHFVLTPEVLSYHKEDKNGKITEKG
jgi:hypothetical protein